MLPLLFVMEVGKFYQPTKHFLKAQNSEALSIRRSVRSKMFLNTAV